MYDVAHISVDIVCLDLNASGFRMEVVVGLRRSDSPPSEIAHGWIRSCHAISACLPGRPVSFMEEMLEVVNGWGIGR